MIKLYQVIFLYIPLTFSIIIAEKYKECDMHQLEVCPETTSCTEHETGPAECYCIEGYMFNKDYKTDDDYCTPVSSSLHLTTTVTNSGADMGTGDKTSSSTQSPYKSHHLLSGIFIPLVVILIIVGIIYVIKRKNVINRIRERMSTRRSRSRPLYEDVIMSNDNDDPPLM